MSVDGLSSSEGLDLPFSDETFEQLENFSPFETKLSEQKSQSLSLSHLFKKKMKDFFHPKKISPPPTLNLDAFSASFSRYYDLQAPELVKGEIGFINGMLTEYVDAKQHAQFLSALADHHNIHGVFKANRPLHLELLESISSFDTPPVLLLQNQWRAFFLRQPDCKYLQICHSQGVLHVKKALEGLTAEERKKIIVVAIAPQVTIPNDLCYKVDHYLSTRDFVPYLQGNPVENSLSQDVHIRAPEKKAPLWDHDFESPSYLEALRFHIENYIEHPTG